MILFGACLSVGAMAQGALVFDANAGVKSKMTVYDGTEVGYTAYERLFYVTNVEDSTYQFLNVYVPDGATQQTPIFLRTYVGGYMASPAAQPQAGDATGRALKEGYVVVILGTRGRNSSIVADKQYAKTHKGVKKGQTVYTGRADKQMPGDAERIITDGTSAGGAMSALMGATGNNPEYAELLKAMGAADERDDVFASICYCPIIDLEHADMAYEWLYQQTDSRQSLDDTHKQMTKELAALFPAYVNSLNLKKPDGTPLTADNYLDYLKSEIIRAAQIAKNAGADIPDSLGFKFTSEAGGMFAAPINGRSSESHSSLLGNGRVASDVGRANGGMRPQMQGGQPPKGMRPMRGGKRQVGEYITDLDMQKYLNYVVSTQALKGVPAFDSQIEGINNASGENEEFGDATGNSVNFTDYTAEKNGTTLTDAIRRNVRLMNPSGDYALDELFRWIADITK